MDKNKKLYFSRNIKLLYSIYLVVIIGISACLSLEIIDNYTGRFIYQQPNISNYILRSLRCDEIYKFSFQHLYLINFSYSEESVLLQNQKYSVEKPNNTFRIIALGDSVTQGADVPFDDSYPAVLERMLNANTSRNMKFEVLNFGLGGFTMPQKVELFEDEALMYKPDLIIIQWWPDDVWNATELTLIFKDLLTNTCQKENYTRLFSTNETIKIWEELWTQTYKIYVNELNQRPFEEVWKPVENSLEELKNTTDGKMRVLALLIPPGTQEYNDYSIAFDQTAFNYGWEVVDMSSVYKNYKDSDIRVSADDPHPNVLGQRLIAEEIYKELYEKKLLP